MPDSVFAPRIAARIDTGDDNSYIDSDFVEMNVHLSAFRNRSGAICLNLPDFFWQITVMCLLFREA